MTRVDDEIVSVRRQVSVLLLVGFCGFGGAALEAEAVISCFDDVAAMGEPIEQRGRHLCVAEYRRPFPEAKVRGDHHC